MTFEQWLKANNITLAPCNCGGPQYGTDHSPDCEWELDAMRRQDQWEEDEAQDDGYDEGMAQGGDAYVDVMYGDSPDY
jgi:hypothetical protein